MKAITKSHSLLSQPLNKTATVNVFLLPQILFQLSDYCSSGAKIKRAAFSETKWWKHGFPLYQRGREFIHTKRQIGWDPARLSNTITQSASRLTRVCVGLEAVSNFDLGTLLLLYNIQMLVHLKIFSPKLNNSEFFLNFDTEYAFRVNLNSCGDQ